MLVDSVLDGFGYYKIDKHIYIASTWRPLLWAPCVVFGNHDGEVGFHTEFQMLMYSEYENCRSNLNDADVYGCGNCCITVKSSDGTKDALAIWLMDSNDYQLNDNGEIRYD